ncbi:MAG: Crp/Fnr family transcriptional regulator, partial [Gammaproteobacteria bacterium]
MSRLFGQLMPAELDRILTLAHARHFSNGEIIFQKVAKDSSMMAVLQGQVKISICSADGKEIILTTIDEGSVFGEIALIDGKERSADATAQAECRLLAIHLLVLEGLVKALQEPQLGGRTILNTYMGEFSLDMPLEAAGDKARAIIRDQKRLLGQGPMP